MEAELPDGKVLRLAVEDRNAIVMSTWRRRRRCRHPNSDRLPLVTSVGEFGFLNYATINLSLRHPLKCRFQTSVPSTLDIIRAKP